MSVVIEAASAPPRAAREAVITTPQGVTVRLTSAYLATRSAELLPCASSPTVLRWLRRSLAIPSAHAHSTSSLTRIGLPLVEDLLAAPGTTTPMGELVPPAGRYCALRYSVGAADADAAGMPAGAALIGKSMHIEGTYRGAADAAPIPFSVAATASFDVDLPFDALDVSAPGATAATVAVGKSLEHWFRGVDFAAMSDEERARAILGNAQRALAATRR